jgi:hypothetical protein
LVCGSKKKAKMTRRKKNVRISCLEEPDVLSAGLGVFLEFVKK